MKTLFTATLTLALLATLGLGTASAGGRSKDDRANFNRTVHESVQPWKAMFGRSTAPTSPVGMSNTSAAKTGSAKTTPAPRS